MRVDTAVGVICVVLFVIALGLLLSGCTRSDRDPLRYYQADPIDFNIPVLAVVPF